MIRPPGAAFSNGTDGDLRLDEEARSRFAVNAAAPVEWASVRQVHGNAVLFTDRGGQVGDGDALWTDKAGLGIAIFTADCLGVVVHAEGAVGVAHAGWRGVDRAVVPSLLTTMREAGHPPRHAAIGPGIGPCCFEVGPEVAERFPAHTTSTTWDTPSVDLASAVADQLAGLVVTIDGRCTMHEDGLFSHRGDATTKRMAALGWM